MFASAPSIVNSQLPLVLLAVATDTQFRRGLTFQLQHLTEYQDSKLFRTVSSLVAKLECSVLPEDLQEESIVLARSKWFLETLWRLVDLRVYEHRLLNFIKRSESNLQIAQDTNELHKYFTHILENPLFEQAVRRRIDALCRDQGYEDRQDLYNSTMMKVYSILLEQHANLRAPGSFRYSIQHPSIIAFASQVAWGVVKDEA